MNALKKGSAVINMQDFDDVIHSVLYGKRKVLTYSDEEKTDTFDISSKPKAICAFWLDLKFDKISNP